MYDFCAGSRSGFVRRPSDPSQMYPAYSRGARSGARASYDVSHASSFSRRTNESSSACIKYWNLWVQIAQRHDATSFGNSVSYDSGTATCSRSPCSACSAASAAACAGSGAPSRKRYLTDARSSAESGEAAEAGSSSERYVRRTTSRRRS